MAIVVSCPTCSIPLAEVDPAKHFDAVCGKCCYRFQVLNTRVLQTSYELFHYLLIIELSSGGKIRHWSGALHAWAQRHLGQVGIVLVTIRRNRPDDILWISGADGSMIKVAAAGSRARWLASWTAASMSLIVLLTAGASILSLLSALVMGVGLFWGVNRLRSPRQRIDEEQRARLREMQSLLVKKDDLIKSRYQTMLDLRRDELLRAQLNGLVAKMEALDRNLYAGRMARLQSGLRLLRDQCTREAELLSEYDKAIAMMDLEIESHRLAEIWRPDMPDIDMRFEKLESLRETIKQRETEIIANEEVESLLDREGTRKPSKQSDELEVRGHDVPPIPLERAFDDLDDDPLRGSPPPNH